MESVTRARSLSFKAVFIEPILEGRKTSTLRRRTSLEPGDRVDAYCHWGKPPFARLRVVRVTEVRLGELDDALADSEGFTDALELRKTLSNLYPGDTRFKRVEWELM